MLHALYVAAHATTVALGGYERDLQDRLEVGAQRRQPLVVSTRRTPKTLYSCSRPNNTDVASDMLVAPLLDVVRDQQHVGATSPSPATTRPSKHPAQVRRIP
jgi:hypothetical protein